MKKHFLIKEAFRVYSRKMDRIYQELNSVKESYSFKESRLLMEAFNKTMILEWQWLDKVAKGATKFVGSAVKTASDIYDKGIELGKKAIEVGKELVDKVKNIINETIQAIKSAPSKLFAAGSELYANISKEIAEMYSSAKEKGGEWIENAKKTAVELYTETTKKMCSLVNDLKAYYEKNMELFNKSVEESKQTAMETTTNLMNSADDAIKTLGKGLKAVLEGTLKGAKAVLIYTVAIPIAIGMAGVTLMNKAYELGKEGVDMMANHIQAAKTYLGENLNSAVAAAKEGWEESESYLKKNEKFILTFEKFVFSNYN
jgi:tetratricopeptide (TPR) repeat protein